MKGIDVSKYQGDIDWAKVKNAGIEFAIIRAGYGNLISQKDPTFDYNYREAKNNGIKVGAYWFGYATNTEDAKKEAGIFIDVIKDCQMDLPVFYDYESESIDYVKKMGVIPTKESTTEIVKAFLGEITNKGYQAGIYSNANFFKSWIDMRGFIGYHIWLAKWIDNAVEENPPNDFEDIACWQYTSNGNVDGISGRVDLNFGYFKDAILVSAPVDNVVASVTASLLNVRKGPGTQYGIIRTISKGNLVDVLESYTNGWSKINIVGLVAYVNHSYLNTYKTPLVEFRTDSAIKVGSKVRVNKGAKTYDGVGLAAFVYSTVYDVIQINGDRIVIGIGKAVTAAVRLGDLTLA